MKYSKEEFLKKTEVLKVEMEVVVSNEDIGDIMCGALEGGITYWCGKVEVVGDYLGEYASEQISRGGELKFFDNEEERVLSLTRLKLMEGIKKYCQKPVGCNCLEQIDGKLVIDCCNADAEVCDSIIQYALFNDVVYG